MSLETFIAAADKLQSSSKTGHTIGTDREVILVDWVSHVHGSGRLIVVSRQRTIRTLDHLLVDVPPAGIEPATPGLGT